MTAPHYPPHHAPPAPPAPRNGLAIAALVLGLVGLPFTLTGLTAWIAIILGIIGTVLALSGLGRVRRGQASKGRTIAGLVASVLALVLGIASTVVTLNALDEVLSGPTATVAGPDGAVAAEQPAGPVALGTAVDVDGLSVVVGEVVERTEFSMQLTCASVAYANNRGDVAHRNPFDWAARNDDGASVSSWIYTGDDALSAGQLAAGGRAEGLVCFDVPSDEVAVVEYRAALASAPTAEWAAR